MSHEPNDKTHTITRLLARSRAGDKSAEGQLWELLQDDLRRIAQSLVNRRGYRRGRGTDLVHDAYLCLAKRNALDAETRDEFFRVLGRKMNDLIVEEHRRNDAIIRGGDRECETLGNDVPAETTLQWDIEEFRRALDELREEDAESARTMDLLYVQKLTLRRAADLMECTVHTILENRKFALTWLRVRLG